MPKKKQKLKQVHPSSLKKQERQAFVAKLCSEGIPLTDVFRKTIGKFGVTRQTVSKDISESRGYVDEYYKQKGLLEHLWVGALNRLVALSHGEGASAVRACEIVLRIANEPNRIDQYAERAEKSRRREAETRYAHARAEIQELNAQLAQKELDASEASEEMVAMLVEMRANGSITYKDLITLVAHRYQSAIQPGNEKNALGVLTLMTKIAESDPNATGAEKQYFQLPAGMELEYEADDGDELLEG